MKTDQEKLAEIRRLCTSAINQGGPTGPRTPFERGMKAVAEKVLKEAQ